MRLRNPFCSRVPSEINPQAESKASLASRLFFHWLQPLIRRGSRQPLQPSDLPPLIPKDQSAVCAPVFNHVYRHVAFADLCRAQPSVSPSCFPTGPDPYMNNASAGTSVTSRNSKPASALLRIATSFPPRLASKTSRALLPLTAAPFLKGAAWKPFWVMGAVAQAFSIRAIVERVTIEAEGIEVDDSRWAYIPIVFAMTAAALLMSFAQHWTFAFSMRAGMRARAALSTEIYRKLLRLSPASASHISEGELGNLLLNDTQRVLDSYTYFHFCAFGLFEIAILGGLLIVDLGLSAFFGIGILILLVPVQFSFSSLICYARTKVSKEADVRVAKMNEILAGIRTVKMSAWEPHFMKVVSSLRLLELHHLRLAALVRASNTAVFFSAPVVVALATFAARTLIFRLSLNPSIVFASLTYFYKLANVLNLMPVGWLAASEASVSSRRLDSFFDLPEVSTASKSERLDVAGLQLHGSQSVSKSDDMRSSSELGNGLPVGVPGEETEWMANPGTRLLIRKGQFSHPLGDRENRTGFATVLTDINLSVADRELLVVVGPVGSGKSSLLLGILGETMCTSGAVDKRGRVAYCAQDPWIVNATLRENITMFGAQQDYFSEEWYETVIEACCLSSDLKLLPAGDHTEIGERGINLSGGQKARVALARAVYSKADIYLFDDPLSAVDSQVSGALVRRVFGRTGLLAEKAQIVVTHQLNLLPSSSQVAVLKSGVIDHIGTYDELVIKGVHFSEFPGPDGESDKPSKGAALYIDDGVEACDVDKKGRSLLPQCAVETDLEPVALETTLAPESLTPTLRAMPKTSAVGDDCAHDGCGEMSNEKMKRDTLPMTDDDNFRLDQPDTKGDLIVDEDRRMGRVTGAVYLAYMKAGGGYVALLIVILAFALAQAAKQVADWWLSRWSTLGLRLPEANEDKILNENRIYASVFFGLALGTAALSLFRSSLYAQRTMSASKRLHDSLLRRVLHAQPSFFDTNPIGRILNRFSKDIDQMDNLLPTTSHDCLQIAFVVVGALTTIAVILPWFLLVLVPIALLFVYLQNMYKTTSRELKRIDGTSRSPIYAQFVETAAGLATVRAYESEEGFSSSFSSRVDANHCAYHIFASAGRWLGIRLDLLSAMIVFCTALVILILSPSLNPGLAGVALTQSILMTGAFQWGVRQAAETENIFTSVERVNTMATCTPIEKAHHVPAKEPPPGWPLEGRVCFRAVFLKYRPHLDYALRNVSFTTSAHERVGIVGRTGSGKSSLLVALFRMVEIAGGSISIDGINVGDIGLHDLRHCISVVPQDPVLFNGTIRSNLDPTFVYNDTQLWDALHRVHMSKVIEGADGTMEGDGRGLDLIVREKGNNFSSGERQLLALARAVLSGVRIVVLDEASASLDNHTDKLVQQTVREQLSDRTVITIAHRLATIADSDRILVMDAGEVVEFDTPLKLLESAGYFARLVEETGQTESALLRAIIEKTSEVGERG